MGNCFKKFFMTIIGPMALWRIFGFLLRMSTTEKKLEKMLVPRKYSKNLFFKIELFLIIGAEKIRIFLNLFFFIFFLNFKNSLKPKLSKFVKSCTLSSSRNDHGEELIERDLTFAL